MQELLEKLVSFKSTENNPEEIQNGLTYIASLFDSLKYDVVWYEKNGKYSLLISFKGHDGLNPKFLLNGHFDVVPAESNDQYAMKVEGGMAYGRGTLDMKGMVAVLLEVMLELGKRESKPNVAVLLNGDEEIGGSDGAGYLVREINMRPGFVICPDAGYEGNFEIVTKEKGIAWVEIRSIGKSAHGAFLWKGDNALEKLIRAVEKIKQWIGPVEPEAWKTTVNFSMLTVPNKTPNKVPGEATALLDIRFTEQIARTAQELTKKIKDLVPEVEVTLKESGSLLFVEEDNATVKSFKKIAQEVLGDEVSFAFEHGATDLRYFGEVGIPGVLFGAKGQNMHAAGEWVDLQSLENNKKILLTFLLSQSL